MDDYTSLILNILALTGGTSAGAIALSVIVGGFTSPEGFKRYISPETGKLELNWFVKEVLTVLSIKMGQRWYDARMHMGLGITSSLLVVVRLLYAVRVEFMHAEKDTAIKIVKFYHGLQSLQKVMMKVGNWNESDSSLHAIEGAVLKLQDKIDPDKNENGIPDAKEFNLDNTFVAGVKDVDAVVKATQPQNPASDQSK